MKRPTDTALWPSVEPYFASATFLGIRLALAYGFFEHAQAQWADINAVGTWFEELGIPAPYLGAYVVASTEALGVVLLALGLGVRLIAGPLIVAMIVAIATVHGANGFDAENDGFEIPLYYILFLLSLICYGPGRFSLNYVFKRYFSSE